MPDSTAQLNGEQPVEVSEPPDSFLLSTQEGEGENDEPPSPLRLNVITEDSYPPAFFNLTIHGTRFPVSPVSRKFRKQYFPQATPAEWNDWRWQLRHRIRDIETLSGIIWLSEEEKEALGSPSGSLPLSITPYYAGLLNELDPMDPIRRSVVPVTAEKTVSPGEKEDPLHEDADSPVPGLVHRYPDRVLFLVTDFCSTYCRYCTRSRLVGRSESKSYCRGRWEMALAYIESMPTVRDVLLSGGDPLTLPDDELEWLLSRLRRIPHVEIVRIGTKVPAVLPQRITHSLVRMLKKYHPLWINIHCTHPRELSPEMGEACARLSDAGIPLGSQTVLLKGINDSVETMKALYHGLLKFRVRPYYLYQCDTIVGSVHFRTPVETGRDIIRGLRGHTTGFAVPHYVIDAPGGGGKIPLLPEYLSGRDADDIVMTNYEGREFRYPDTAERSVPARGA